MSNLIPRRPMPVQVLDPEPSLNRQIVRAQNPGMVAAARLQSAAFATNVAIQHATMLSRATDTAFRISPMGEEVYRSIFGAFGAVATAEIQRLGLHSERGSR